MASSRVGVRILRVEPYGLGEVIYRRLVIIRIDVGVASINVGRNEVRLETYRLVVTRYCFGVLSQFCICQPTFVPTVRVVRVQPNRIVEVIDRTPILAERTVRSTPSVVGEGLIGIEPDGLTVLLNGPLVLAKIEVSVSPVVVNLGVLGIETGGQVPILDCPLVVFLSIVS